MSLEQLIEQDMVRFLDGEVKEPTVAVKPRYEDTALLFLNKDWSLEINRLLKRNDIEQARRAFDELKQHYSTIPESHPEEKKRTYGVLQDCYILIVNFMQDKVRTNALLQRMEQSPDDVFDFSVKPIDLQRMPQEKRIEIPELPQITKEMLNAGGAHPLAKQHSIALPPPPASMGGIAGGDGTAGGGLSGGVQGNGVGAQGAPTASHHDQQAAYEAAQKTFHEASKFVANARQTLQHSLVIARTDPERAAQMLHTLRDDLQGASVSPEIKQTLSGHIDVLDAAVASFNAKREFSKYFNTAYAAISQMGRSHDGQIVEAFGLLRKKVADFESANPTYKGSFDESLEKLKYQYAIYTEDELIEHLLPLLQAIKSAVKAQSSVEFMHAINELEAFAHHLPHTEHRELLEHAVASLRAKTIRRKVAEDTTADRLRTLLHDLNVSFVKKDAAAYAAALRSFTDLVNSLPAGNDRAVLENTLGKLRTKMDVILRG